MKTALESEKGKSCFRILAEAAEGVTVSAIFPFARRFRMESWGWGCRWGWGGVGGEYHCNTRKCHPFRLPSLSSFSTPGPIRANLYIFDCVTGHVIRGAVSVLALAQPHRRVLAPATVYLERTCSQVAARGNCYRARNTRTKHSGACYHPAEACQL